MRNLLCFKRFLSTDVIGDDNDIEELVQREQFKMNRVNRSSLQQVSLEDFVKPGNPYE